ncbi:porin [Variovorax humicola]|uniref:Porin n=1 Tax=Variovorax humicola TaxID=1769758 RepID=A0ABU8W0E2_9BURK
MKKSLLPLVAVLSVSAASAQSSVTLFGVLDASISHYKVGSATSSTISPTTGQPVFSATSERRQTVLGNGNSVSSRLGFRGTEDLGGGLAAGFWLEAPLSNDDGSIVRPPNFTRRSTVSLIGGFGEIRLGRDYVPSFYNDSIFDPFQTNGVGTNIINQTSGVNRSNRTVLTADPNYNRAPNSVGYFLPPVLGGVYGQAMYSFNENVQTDAPLPNGLPFNTSSQRGRYVGGRVGYAKGPFDVALAYGQSTLGNFGGTVTAPFAAANFANAYDANIKTANFGIGYDFDVVKITAELSQVKTSFGQPVFTNPLTGAVTRLPVSESANSKGFLVGAQVPIGPHVIKFAYSRVATGLPDSTTVVTVGAARVPLATDTPDPTVSKIALGYVYNLSKRTALYATVAKIDNKNGSAIAGFNGNNNSATPITGSPNSHNFGYDLGLRHAF